MVSIVWPAAQNLWWGCGSVSAALGRLSTSLVRLRLQLSDWRQLLRGEQTQQAQHMQLLSPTGPAPAGADPQPNNSHAADGSPDDGPTIDVGLRAAPLVLVPWHDVGALPSLRHLELANGEPGRFSVTGLQVPATTGLTHLTLDGFTLRHWGWEGGGVVGEEEEAWEEECDEAIEVCALACASRST